MLQWSSRLLPVHVRAWRSLACSSLTSILHCDAEYLPRLTSATTFQTSCNGVGGTVSCFTTLTTAGKPFHGIPEPVLLVIPGLTALNASYKHSNSSLESPTVLALQSHQQRARMLHTSSWHRKAGKNLGKRQEQHTENESEFDGTEFDELLGLDGVEEIWPSTRQQRKLASRVEEALAAILERGEPWAEALINSGFEIISVRMSPDGMKAYILWDTEEGAEEVTQKQIDTIVKPLRAALARMLQRRHAPSLHFRIDRLTPEQQQMQQLFRDMEAREKQKAQRNPQAAESEPPTA